jgi:hypothetical protein
VERGGRQRGATSGAVPLSPSYGVASSMTGAARIGVEAASDTTVRTGDFYTGKQLPDATAQLSQSGCGAARPRPDTGNDRWGLCVSKNSVLNKPRNLLSM